MAGMLSTSDHHHAPAKRGRSPPATPRADGASTGASLSASPAAKKTKTTADAEPLDPNLPPAFAAWGRPPQTPSKKKASTILASKTACRDLVDDIGRTIYREGRVSTDELDEFEALGLAAYRLYTMVRSVLNQCPGYDRRMRVTLPELMQTSQAVQTDNPPTTTNTDHPVAPCVSAGAATFDRTSPERTTAKTANLAAPDSRGPTAPLRPAKGAHRATHKPPIEGQPPRSVPPPRAPVQARGSPRSRPATRLIVRYGDTGVLRDRPRPHSASFRHTLNTALGGEWIAGVSYSRIGQLVLHTKAPFSAQQLALRGDVLRPAIRAAFGLADDPRPVFETDVVWSKVVVHRVPLPPSGDSTEAMDIKMQAFFADVCSSNGFDSRLVRRMQLLCPKGEEEQHFQQSTHSSPRFLSVVLCISDSKLASRLLRDGAFWQGAHCRVSTYRPRING